MELLRLRVYNDVSFGFVSWGGGGALRVFACVSKLRVAYP